MNRLANKICIVTGAAQGMGEFHARAFADEGAQVVMTDINEYRGRQIAAEIGDRAVFVRHDVANWDDWTDVVAQAEAAFGKVNVLINNAGILGPVARTADLDLAAYEQVCAVNQTSVFLGMKAVIPAMIAAGGGSIVNISSVSGLIAMPGTPNLAYTGTKFAVRGMTKQAAAEYGADNIRVNSVHPAFILTPMMIEALGEGGGGELPGVPLGRLADPIEVSRLLVFLASDESSFITGTEQVIDGGRTAV